jgi:hypothetical protein
MATSAAGAETPKEHIRELGRRWAALRERSCLLFVSRSIEGPDVLTVRDAIAGWQGEDLDVIVASPGGDVGVAYVLARELRRSCPAVTAVVPLRAKSAATLLCLACDEIVLGPLGELGPLDEQVNERQSADFPAASSRLVPFTTLAQLHGAAVDSFDAVTRRILEKSGMKPGDACTKAAELTSALYGRLYAQLDPTRLGESARGLEVGAEYALRLLRRYRPSLEAEQAKQLVRRLVHGYPSHGFVIDYEEATELGLPARLPLEAEAPLIEELATALIVFGTDEDLIERTGPPPGAIAASPRVPDDTRQPRPARAPGRRRAARRVLCRKSSELATIT